MSSKDYTRRAFLETITGATLSAMGAGLVLPSVSDASPERYTDAAPSGGIILFQGDSITDAGRERENNEPNSPPALGQGYAFLAAAHLRHSMAVNNLNCYNRGVSGNKVFQLARRWDEDCLQLKPDLLSILIGVNDFWHSLRDYDGTIEVYERDFRSLLKRTREKLPGVRLIIGEPFAVREGSAVDQRWFPAFTAYQRAAKQIARDFDAAFIPYQQIFDEASKTVEPVYWISDGVHPTMAGSQLMATAWLETVANLDS